MSPTAIMRMVDGTAAAGGAAGVAVATASGGVAVDAVGVSASVRAADAAGCGRGAGADVLGPGRAQSKPPIVKARAAAPARGGDKRMAAARVYRA